jgi:outer membrane protein insertion porin family
VNKLTLLITTASLVVLAAPAFSQQQPLPSTATASTSTRSETINRIRVEGNQRIETRTIITYLGMKEGDAFDRQAISIALKELFNTGFFADVKLVRSGNDLVVRVVENPVINQVAFEGNDHTETKDLEKEIELKPRSIYTKTKVQNDVKRILDIYRRAGRYTATVNPKIIQQDQNRVDLVYEINEGPVARIEHISFIGNETFSSSELENVIRSSENRWYKFLTDSDKYDPDRLQFDQELLRRFYTSQGYADFQVKSAHAELSPNKDAFYVSFVVDEGAKYTLGKVETTSTLKGNEQLDYSKFLTTKSGDDYDSTAIESSVDALTTEVENLGYAFVNIDPRLTRDRERKIIDLNYEIKPGPRVYVERINIIGNVRTLDSVIRREFRLAEGDPFNSSKLKRSEQRLNNLNFFEKVNVTNEVGSAPDKTVITVEVTEKSTGEINMGAGFSSTDGPLADFGIKENNLLGRGQQLHTRFTYASRRKQVEIGFTEPYFLNRDLSAGFDVFRTRYDYVSESSYNLDSKGLNLRMGYNLREKLAHQFYYSLRDNDITDVDPLASLYIKNQIGRTVNSAIGHALIYDDLNNKLDPSSGYYLRASQEVAGLGGDAKYVKHEGKASYYYPLAKSWTASLTGSGGHIIGYSNTDVGIADRFFTGGETIRGFTNSGIGARDKSTNDALGGNIYYAATAETRFPLGLPEDLGILGAAFVDAGSLWGIDGSKVGVFDSSTPRLSAGVGISWASPFGPIRLDFAHAIRKQNADETENFRFSFGTRF